MSTFIGFSTQRVYKDQLIVQQTINQSNSTIKKAQQLGKKFRITDQHLVIQDVINSLSIKQGDKVGRPDYGTKLWEYIFEPSTSDIINEVETEIRRVIQSDPRVALNDVNVYTYENGILVELQINVVNIDDTVTFSLLIDKRTGTIKYVPA